MARVDDHAERRILALTAVGGIALLSVVSAVELVPWALDGVAPVDADGVPVLGSSEPSRVLTIALLLVLGAVGVSLLVAVLLLRLPVLDMPLGRRVAVVGGLSVVIGAVRTGAISLGLPQGASPAFTVLDTALGSLEAFAAIMAALYFADTRRRIRDQERRRLEEAHRADRARVELEREELRVRREVSQQLHGGLQQRLVMAIWELEAIRDDLDRRGETTTAESIGGVSDALDRVRESEVRAVAHALYPLAADIDLPAALLLLADQLPASAQMQVQYEGTAHRLVAGNALTSADRVVLFSVVEEGVTNAVRHGRARTIHVVVSAADAEPSARRTTAHLTVDDDGVGLGAHAPELSGLAALGARIRRRGGDLELGPSPLGGARLEARVPIEAPSHDADTVR